LGHSFSAVGNLTLAGPRTRFEMAALALVAGIAVGACGGDDGGGDDTNPTPKDASSVPPGGDAGPVVHLDGGNTLLDSGIADARVLVVPADASADEVAAAINPTGIDISTRRVEIVFPLACDIAAKCNELDPGDTLASCKEGSRKSYDDGVAAGYPASCLDATLDEIGCFGIDSCDNDCTPLLDAQKEICGPYIK
jgi:hypothetical protein